MDYHLAPQAIVNVQIWHCPLVHLHARGPCSSRSARGLGSKKPSSKVFQQVLFSMGAPSDSDSGWPSLAYAAPFQDFGQRHKVRFGTAWVVVRTLYQSSMSIMSVVMGNIGGDNNIVQSTKYLLYIYFWSTLWLWRKRLGKESDYKMWLLFEQEVLEIVCQRGCVFWCSCCWLWFLILPLF